ncbi:hypothetical protein BC835DRAFT_1549299 [Cytidiella melzeri]|nr:hypothetical protein BC835DRAFT_1549299 [Cytidiella melzeri]
MGQSSSRPRTPPHSTPRPDITQISEPTIQRDVNGQPVRSDHLLAQDRARLRPSMSTAATPESAQRSRRRSMRQQLQALRPSSRPSSLVSSPQMESGEGSFFKRPWRSSKRCSKAPERNALVEPVDELGHTNKDGQSIHDEQRRYRDVAGSSSSGTASNSSRPSTPFPLSGPSTPLPDNKAESGSELLLSDEEQQASHNIGSWLGGSSGSASPADEASIHREVLDFLHDATPDQDPREPEAQLDSSPIPEGRQSPARAAHFQAPSTLVVVQGVVNAQDPHPPNQHPVASQTLRPSSRLTVPTPRRSSSTPRLGTSSSSTAEDRLRTRNRLSSFIRPSGALGRSQADEVASASLDPVSFESLENSGRVDNSIAADGDIDASSNDQPVTLQSDARVSPRGLSAGSIDVLGTLLRCVPGFTLVWWIFTDRYDSVAATATAASLFSPPAATRAYHHAPSLPSSPSAATRPLSPTPTSGLGALGALGGLGLNSPSQNSTFGPTPDGRDRIRHAWDSIRDMVGLNSRNSAESTLPSLDASSAPTDQRTHTGDAMLADMARLLNAGLGLPPSPSRPSEGSTATNITVPSPSTQANDASRPPPAEGSFERFLFNLQADLRNILGEDSESSTAESADNSSTSDPDGLSSSASTEANNSPSRSGPATDAIAEHPDIPREDDDVASDVEHSSTSMPAPVSNEAGDPEDMVEAQNQMENGTAEAEEDVTVRPRVPTPIPSMWSSSPAYNETRERVSRARSSGFSDVPSRSHPSPPRAEGASIRAERDRPIINLWRLYRFAPIPASQAQENVSRTSRPSTATPSSATPPVSSVDSAPLNASNSSSVGATAPEVQTSTDGISSDEEQQSSPTHRDHPTMDSTPEMPAFVIPVIVVGLQSVETRSQEEDDDGMAPNQPLRDSTTSGSSRTPDSPVAWPSQPTSPTGSAGRSWGSRAANALRGWRPGTRRTSRASRSSDGTGSRTFLIYVIGGYYPPGHHMVTGSDQLDSYDALWELAELLGQAKPPTATEEEIEKSGLEVIKASQLGRYEADGKISSNCTDRCLVCLDDYEPEDEVRLLSCRHGFHKDCVDRWLQVGRNNCPACRTKGVSEESPSSPSSSATSDSRLRPTADGGN